MTALQVSFTGTWFTDPADPAHPLRVDMADRSQDSTVGAEVRLFAGGRRRIISTPARTVSSQVTLRKVTWPQLVRLRSWQGRLLLMRDGSGWRRWGMYPGLQESSVYAGVPQEDNEFVVVLTWTDSDVDESVS